MTDAGCHGIAHAVPLALAVNTAGRAGYIKTSGIRQDVAFVPYALYGKAFGLGRGYEKSSHLPREEGKGKMLWQKVSE